jgi:hypothetical protein
MKATPTMSSILDEEPAATKGGGRTVGFDVGRARL